MTGTRYKSMCLRNILRTSASVMILLFLLVIPNALKASHVPDHKCSHIPPKIEEINYIWTPNSNRPNEIIHSETEFVSNYEPLQEEFNDIEKKRGIFSNNLLKKRHVEERTKELISPLELESNYLPSPRKESSIHNHFSLSHNNKNDLIPMKISVHYDESVYQLEEPKSSLIRVYIFPRVIEFFEKALSIRREFAIDTFRITRRCANITYTKDNNNIPRPFCLNKCDDHSICGEMLVPTSHLAACSYCNTTSKKCYTNYSMEGKGVPDTQLLLYVSAKQTHRCGREQTVAYAAHCAQDSKTDRPVAGHANLCPNSISADPKDLNSLIATVKHELTHVLGFSVSLFAYYRDQDGKPLTDRQKWSHPTNMGSSHLPKDPKTGYPIWSDKIIKRVVRKGWVSGRGQVDKEVHLLVTPSVVREVRAHFNCSTLEGAELEDQGHDGTSMTHWEKRLFENEAMTGTHTHRSVYSRLTLAALQDTGWYVANFSVAERLFWGKDLGCDFATQSCKYWIDKQRSSNSSISPFCDKIKGDQLQITCTSDYSAKAVCNMRKYKQPLADFYRNFHELDGVHSNELGFYGGTVDLADYCPYVQEYTIQQNTALNQGSRCSYVENNLDTDKNVALEFFGPSSKCFVHGRQWTNRTCSFKRKFWPHLGAGCYRTSCGQGFISLTVHNLTYSCFYKGQELDIVQEIDNTIYNGSIICPACDTLCPAKSCKQYNKIIIDDIISILHFKGRKDRMKSALHNKDSSFDHERPGINRSITGIHHHQINLPSSSIQTSKRTTKSIHQQETVLISPTNNENSLIDDDTSLINFKTNNQKFPLDTQLLERWLMLLNKTSPQSHQQTMTEKVDVISNLEQHLKVFRIMSQLSQQNHNFIEPFNSSQLGNPMCSRASRIQDMTNFRLKLIYILIVNLNFLMLTFSRSHLILPDFA